MANFNVPVIIFGSMIAALIGSIVHLVAGGKFIRLIFCMIFSLIGFWIGNYVSSSTGVTLLRFGIIDYGLSILSSLVLSIFGFWLSGENKSLN